MYSIMIAYLCIVHSGLYSKPGRHPHHKHKENQSCVRDLGSATACLPVMAATPEELVCEDHESVSLLKTHQFLPGRSNFPVI